jgi:hypothetical protein
MGDETHRHDGPRLRRCLALPQASDSWLRREMAEQVGIKSVPKPDFERKRKGTSNMSERQFTGARSFPATYSMYSATKALNSSSDLQYFFSP